MADELVYNPFEDKDVRLPVYKLDGKNLVLPFFICGMRTNEITARKTGDSLSVTTIELEVHESVEKLGTITIFNEDEEGRYIYNRGAVDKEVPASVFAGTKVKGGDRIKLWKNNSRGSSRTNKILISNLKQMGVNLETRKVKHEGKNVEVEVIPEITEDLLLGLPVFGWLDEESFTTDDGRNISYTAVNKIVKMDVDKVDVMENSLKAKQTGNSPAPKDENDPFSDMDDDLPF